MSVAWVIVSGAAILADQIALLPPRPPTQIERNAAAPAAQARWGAVELQLAGRLTYSPPEFGAVWASRSGRICGVVTRLEAGVYFREPFYTDGSRAHFASDDERKFVRSWLDCVGDHWVDLRPASDEVGFCAVPRNQNSPIGSVLCTHGNLHAGYRLRAK